MYQWLCLLANVLTFAGVADAATHAHGTKGFGRCGSWWLPLCDWTTLSAAESPTFWGGNVNCG